MDEQGTHVNKLDELFTDTKDSILGELYKKASRLLPDDEPQADMGLILLFSYNCFNHFHYLLQQYFSGVPEEAIVQSDSYKTLEMDLTNGNI
jgi:hypothetical protein